MSARTLELDEHVLREFEEQPKTSKRTICRRKCEPHEGLASFGSRRPSIHNLLVKNSASGDVKNSEEMCCSRNANGGNHNREECSQTNAYVDSWKLWGIRLTYFSGKLLTEI
ncbi:hypothetical protein TNIN_405981 [Trichonephila inaurata madagascariensis]|uniref:Uncharacterized protein n=1 Tax=Trichonephila inaurata madagascariensis TaxID=2747483 RepID=A0A8X6IWD3_9ARAC|nr:hypothetical protein TNIN_405981 [Trichonephila inaurata madagascariensis]